ncbi:MAG: PulJ/GspJ family protein [Opitutales bacterium]
MRPSNRTTTRKALSRTAGFTLIEIVVATFIMAVFTVLVLGVSNGVLQIWSSAAGRVESTRESRLVLSTIESDFDGIVYTSDGEVLYYDVEDIGGGNFYPKSQAQLYMVASTLDAPARDFNQEERPGDICAIRYELNYLEIFGGAGVDPKFSLYRGAADTLTTFNNFLAVDSLSQAWTTLIDSGTYTQPYNEANDISLYSTQNRRNIYASNVVDFRIVFYARDAATGVIYPVSSDNLTAKLANPATPVTVTDIPVGIREGRLYIGTVGGGYTSLVLSTDELVYADLEFAFLSSEGATVLEQHIDGLDTSFDDPDLLLPGIIDTYGQRFSRRVALNGAR